MGAVERTAGTRAVMARGIMATDAAFKGLSANHTGFHIWRIENMQIVAVPVEAWGKFYTGDSYIIYISAASGASRGARIKSELYNGKLEQHIHMWLGSNTSQDEATVAAYKCVELDEHIGGAPIQHREVQGMESNQFLAYFKNGIRYICGGVKTGLSHYVEDNSPKLFEVKGKRMPLIRQLYPISWTEMNHGDCYIIDFPEESVIFVWQGSSANKYEKHQASIVAQNLKAEHGGTDYEVVVLLDGNESNDETHIGSFNQILPISEKHNINTVHASSDTTHERSRENLKLYRCSDSTGKLVLEEVKNGPLYQMDLKSADTFLIDNRTHGIWVWIGKKASNNERREAMRNAQGFIKAKGLNSATPITRVIDGGEPIEFKLLFQEWKDKDQTTTLGRKSSSTVIGKGITKTIQTKFDAKTMHENPHIAASNGMVDDGSGDKEVFRVKMFDLINVPERAHGIFFSGDCYVILYSYNDGKKNTYIIYYWIGANSSVDEQGAAALRTIELDDRLDGLAVQVRVVQGKESQHFLAMFGGKMIVFSGGNASAFDGENGEDVGVPKQYLLQVHGTNRFSTRAVEVPLRASSLNTNDCFILMDHYEVVVWFGKGSTGDEREMAKILGLERSPDPIIIFEGQEKPFFWQILGGKEDYFNEATYKQNLKLIEPRLFECTNNTGIFRAEEIFDFTQADLLDDDVMLLDAYHTVFLWLGANSNSIEQQEAVITAEEYIATCPTDRDINTPIIIVKQGREPISFTGFFGPWDEELWGDVEEIYTYRKLSRAGKSINAELTYSTLSGPDCPETVDPERKEEYLSDDEFRAVFKIDRDDFNTLPEWKKNNLKKLYGLF